MCIRDRFGLAGSLPDQRIHIVSVIFATMEITIGILTLLVAIFDIKVAVFL